MSKAIGKLPTAEQDNARKANPFNIDYDRFTEADISDRTACVEVNCCMRKFNGINAIAKIIKAAAVETNAQGMAPLVDEILLGLADALIELAMDGGIQIENLGIHLSAIEKEAK